MARKFSPREFPEQSFGRQESAAGTASAHLSKLGVEIAGDSWLVDLASISEVIPVPEHFAVPRTLGWFLGVANLRGNLYGITDLSAFLGRGAAVADADHRVLLAHPRFGVNAGLLVPRVLGPRNAEQFQSVEPAPGAAPWLLAEYTAEDGSRWKELDVAALVRHSDFLNIGAYRGVDVVTRTAREPAGIATNPRDATP
jgi:twitching motility protein PilI